MRTATLLLPLLLIGCRSTTEPDEPAARELAAVPLWADSTPSITPFLPLDDARSRGAVLVFPGGAYWALATTYEGDDVARWFAAHGIVAFVVRYRVAPFHYPTELYDAARAIRLVRALHAEYGLDPKRVGVIGFSAGGHLASVLGTHFDAGDPAAADSVERQPSRPDFLVLAYPVITMEAPYVTTAARDGLLGADPPSQLLRLLSSDEQVTSDTPPTFLVAARDDQLVDFHNTTLFADALASHGVPVEEHLYPRGGHGFGIGGGDSDVGRWPEACLAFLRSRGLLP